MIDTSHHALGLPEGEDLLILGVTGGIASGKSTVARMLEELGAPLIDFDILAREVVAPGQPAFQEIVSYFGAEVIGEQGKLDRKRLSGIVFRHPEKRRMLEGMTHPRILTAFAQRLGEIARKDPHAIVQAVVPLLFETHLEPLVHKVVVVYVPPEIQIERLMRRDRIDREEACRILEAQMPIDRKAARADVVIHNEGSLEETKKEVEALWRRLGRHSEKALKGGSMNRQTVSIHPVDRVEILTLMDNYVDVLLTNTPVVTRPPLSKSGTIPADTLLAEHGLSLLVTAYRGDEAHTVLFDTGYSRIGVLHNVEMLGVDLGRVEALALSHGHMDHTGSLYPLLERIGRRIPLVVHPGVFDGPRFFGLPDGRRLLFPQTLIRQDLLQKDVELVESVRPTVLAAGGILVTGEVERITPFEKGLPNASMERDGQVMNDPIADDQALVVYRKGKGLVIIAGCSHAGIINTIRYAQKITGIEAVHAVIGGFHLSGPFFEKIIQETIGELRKIGPTHISPMHCTGWKAIHQISEAFPDEFVLNSVGSVVAL